MGDGGKGVGDPPALPPPGAGAPVESKPLTEEQWRTRAAAAEERADRLQRELGECQKLLDEAREAIDAAGRRNQVERELVRQGAIDLETTVLLTEAAVASMPKTDVAAAVADLKRRKPFLFRGSKPGGSMASLRDGAVPDESASLAAQARASGDRAALMRYLKSKRK